VRTSTKLLLSFAVVTALCIGAGAIAIRANDRLVEEADVLFDHEFKKLSAAERSLTAMVLNGRDIRRGMLATDPAVRAKWVASASKWQNTLSVEVKTIVSLLDSADKASDGLQPRLDDYLASQRPAVEATAAGDRDRAFAALTAAKPMSSAMENVLTATIEESRQQMKARFEQARATAETARITLITTIVLAALLSAIIAFVVSRQITSSLGLAVQFLGTVARGDLTVAVNSVRKDEFGVMARSLDQAVASVRRALEEVREVASEVASASAQLSASSQDISSGAQEQASSLEETAASLEQITGTIKQNSENAQQAAQLAASARNVADKGRQVVSSAVTAMGEISQSSGRIVEIITTIDDIAFQTNLLALNAAVEAARAGQQGRGFAVVATEVRNLAQRSATSAKEIKSLIQESVKRIESGTELVNQSGTSLEEIVGGVKRVTDIVGEIAAASKEQSTGVEQVNKAVTQMDGVTQSNASQTEELSATASNLSSRATQLQELVGRFTLGTQRARPMIRRPVAAAPQSATPQPPPAPEPRDAGFVEI
jgi:methyl-accepting chemotaxis protein